MKYVSKTFTPEEARDWCASMRKYGHFRTDKEVAFYAGITAFHLASLKQQGGGKKVKSKCQEALDRLRREQRAAKPKPAPVETPRPKPVEVVMDMPDVGPVDAYGNLSHLLTLLSRIPAEHRMIGRAYTPEERAAFLRRSKRGN